MTLLIAGWGKDAKPIAYLGIMKCPNCRNYDHFQLYEVAKKISAFFVPVAKWGRKYYMVCNVCEAGVEISDNEKEQLLVDSAEQPSAEDTAAIWDALCAEATRPVDDDSDVDGEMDQVFDQLAEQYGTSHVAHVTTVWAEYMEDDDKAE